MEVFAELLALDGFERGAEAEQDDEDHGHADERDHRCEDRLADHESQDLLWEGTWLLGVALTEAPVLSKQSCLLRVLLKWNGHEWDDRRSQACDAAACGPLVVDPDDHGGHAEAEENKAVNTAGERHEGLGRSGILQSHGREQQCPGDGLANCDGGIERLW